MESASLHLPDAFAREAQLYPELLKRPRIVSAQAETALHDAPVAVGQLRDQSDKRLPIEPLVDLVVRINSALILNELAAAGRAVSDRLVERRRHFRRA